MILGVACHDLCGRTFAAVGKGGPPPLSFKEALADVPGAGVLCAIPALLANSLLLGAQKHFAQPRGYYPLGALLLLLAFLSLARIRCLEGVRYLPPGEWGRMLGLDRIPEVRTLRRKLETLSKSGDPEAHARTMSEFWMREDESLAGILYVDGHVRTYHGKGTELPRRFSSRERLCVRSMMDYWVNDRLGKPFFVIPVVGTEGMIHHLQTTIIPTLKKEVPGQPSEEDLAQDPARHRFTVVVDREGYSPAFFAELWTQHRIAIQTYRRGEVEPWPEAEFVEQEVVSPAGNTSLMLLAERAAVFAATHEVPVREIRRLSADRDHQTAILTTDRLTPAPVIAAHMFARWDQENFFKYASREFAIDHLPGRELTPSPDTETVRNPAYNRIECDLKRTRTQRAAVQRELGKILLPGKPDAAAFDRYCRQMLPLQQKLADLDLRRKELLELRKKTAKRIKISDLPEEQRPKMLAPLRTQFLNTIHITAYRAETAMTCELRRHLARPDDARAILQELFKHDADLIPDQKARTLTVRLHHFANRQTGRAVQALLDTLNETEIDYPDTNLRLRYELVSPPSPPDQEV